MEPRQTLRPGTRVYAADGDELGTIESSEDAGFILSDGNLPTDALIPMSAIAMSRDGEIRLSVSSADARAGRWTLGSAAPSAPEPAMVHGSDYSAVQGEDSLMEDPMPTPGNEQR